MYSKDDSSWVNDSLLTELKQLKNEFKEVNNESISDEYEE